MIDEEKTTSIRRYHTITEVKNGAGAVPVKTEKGWIHISHGIRNTAAGLRYVINVFTTDLEDPAKVIAEHGGLLIGPRGEERVGDVSNVVFTNGAIATESGDVCIYYAFGDTRFHVAVTTIDRLVDYVFHTPADPIRFVDCVAQRCELIRKSYCSQVPPRGVFTRIQRDKPETVSRQNAGTWRFVGICCCERSEQ